MLELKRNCLNKKNFSSIIILSFLLNINSYAEKNIEIKFLGNKINFLDQDAETHIEKIAGNVEEFSYQNYIYIQSKNKKITKILETFIFDNHGQYESRFRMIAKDIFYKSGPDIICNNSQKNLLHKVTDNNQLYISCVSAKVSNNENKIYEPKLKDGWGNHLRLDLRKTKIKSIIDKNNLVVPNEIIKNEHYFYKADKIIWIIFSDDKNIIAKKSNKEKLDRYISDVKKIHQNFENKFRFKNYDKIIF